MPLDAYAPSHEIIAMLPNPSLLNQNSLEYPCTYAGGSSSVPNAPSPLQQEAMGRAQKVMLLFWGPNGDGKDPNCLQYLFAMPIFPIQNFAKEVIKMLDQIKPQMDWLQQNGREILKGMPRSEEKFKKYIEEPKTGNRYSIGLDNLYVDMGKKLQGYTGDYDQEALISSSIYISSHMSLLCDILRR